MGIGISAHRLAGAVEPIVADTYPLADIAVAQQRFVDGNFVGKLVVIP